MTPQDAPAFTATVVTMRRMQNSEFGNPQWEITFDNGNVFTTKRDSQVAYAIGQFSEGARFDVYLVNVGHGRSKIVRMERV